MTVADHEIRLIDAREGLKALPDRSVDLIITDPAYESLEKWRSMGTTTRLKESKGSSNKWFDTIPNDYYVPFFEECVRVLKRNTYLWVQCDELTSHIVYAALREIGLAEDRIGFGYWRKIGKPDGPPCDKCGHQKMKPGTPGMGYPLRSVIEKLVLAKIGKPKAPEDRKVRDDLGSYWLEEPHLKGKQYYSTEKPVPLLETLMRQSNLAPDSFVVDPFAGSGAVGEAAFNLGHRFLGFDTNPEALEYFEARKRKWVTPDGHAVVKPEDDDQGVLGFFGG